MTPRQTSPGEPPASSEAQPMRTATAQILPLKLFDTAEAAEKWLLEVWNPEQRLAQ